MTPYPKWRLVRSKWPFTDNKSLLTEVVVGELLYKLIWRHCHELIDLCTNYNRAKFNSYDIWRQIINGVLIFFSHIWLILLPTTHITDRVAPVAKAMINRAIKVTLVV